MALPVSLKCGLAQPSRSFILDRQPGQPGSFSPKLGRLIRPLRLSPGNPGAEFAPLRCSTPAPLPSSSWRCEARGPPEGDSSRAGEGGSDKDWDSAWQSFRGGEGEPARPPPEVTPGTPPQGLGTGGRPTPGNEAPREDPLSAGPRLTRWGGQVRGGRFQMGEGTDRILALWGNGDAMLLAAGAILVLLGVLACYIPPPPSSPPGP